VLAIHVPRQILERPIAAWAHAMADAVLDSGNDTSGGGQLALCLLSQLALPCDLVILLGKTLLQAVALAAQLLFLSLPLAEVLLMPVGAPKGDTRTSLRGIV
jgi:hypothetical protein